jgi:heat shock protein HslJ
MVAESCNSKKEAATTDNVQQNNIMIQQTLSGTYTIENIEGNTSFSEKLTIAFDDASKMVSGFSGCNSFFGSYTVDGNTIEFGDIGSSKKYCQEDKNNLERQFLAVLAKANNFTVGENSVSFLKDETILLKANKEAHTASKPSREMVNSKQDIVGDNYTKTFITYQALSRGSFEYIQVSKSEVVISSDRNLKNMDSYTCKADDWEDLKRMLKGLNVEKLDQLKAPTNKRLHDGAAHASLTVIKGDVAMATPSFDHGTPPKEIEALVNKLLSIKENAVKQ